MEQIFPNSQKFEHVQTVCTRLFFSTHTLEPGNVEKIGVFFNCWYSVATNVKSQTMDSNKYK